MTTIGIIGTAGRRTDFDKLDVVVYNWMKLAAFNIISELRRSLALDRVCLVSGGAAWSDHIAVSLFVENKVDELRLHLPAPFLINEFDDTEDGRVANYYHKKFGQKCYMQKHATLKEIGFAINQRALVTVNQGFRVRNALVARDADFMIAFTFGIGAFLKDGGTAHTMSMFLAKGNPSHSWHVNLNDRITYSPAQVNSL